MIKRIKNWFRGIFRGVQERGKQTLDDLPQAFREALALHNVFLAFGIPEEDIYVAHSGKSFQVVCYQKNTSYPNERLAFYVDVANIDMDVDTFTEAWTRATEIYNASTGDERVEMVKATQVCEKSTMIVVCMLSKGFKSDFLDKTSLNETETKDLN